MNIRRLMTLGALIRQMREKRGLDQSQLAGLIDLTQAALSRIENDITQPKTTTKKKLAEALGLAPNFFDLNYMPSTGNSGQLPNNLIERNVDILVREFSELKDRMSRIENSTYFAPKEMESEEVEHSNRINQILKEKGFEEPLRLLAHALEINPDAIVAVLNSVANFDLPQKPKIESSSSVLADTQKKKVRS